MPSFLMQMPSKKTSKAAAVAVEPSSPVEAPHGLKKLSIYNTLTNNEEIVVGSPISPLSVVFANSEYDTELSRRLVLSVPMKSPTADYLQRSVEVSSDVAFPFKTFTTPEGIETLQLSVKTLNTALCNVLHTSGESTPLTEYELKRGDKVQLIIKPYQYTIRNKPQSKHKSGMSLQLWAIKVISSAPEEEAKAAVPFRVFTSNDF
jgi:hypothetical protein